MADILDSNSSYLLIYCLHPIVGERMQAYAITARHGFFRSLVAIAANACIVRYRFDRPIGILYMLAAILDPFVYSGVIYFVLATIFGRDDVSRFHLLLLGIIAFRWTLSCLIQALSLHVIRDRMSEVTRYGYVGAIIAVMAPSTLAFMLSLSLALAWSIAADVPGRFLGALWALPGVILFQCLSNAALVMTVDLLRRARIMISHTPIIAFAAIVWFLSPFMYRLDDIPNSTSRILTSFNPVSHVIAAYQNAYWYGHIPSMNVLPAAIVALLAAITTLHRFGKQSDTHNTRSVFSATLETSPLLIITHDGVPHLTYVQKECSIDRPQVFSQWRVGENFHGSDLTRMILAARGLPFADIHNELRRVQIESRIGRLFDEDIALFPDWARDQLAFVMALRSPAVNLVLDGILNNVTVEFLVTAWRQLETETSRGRVISVFTNRPLPLSANAKGTFRILGSTGLVAEGKIGPHLKTEYERTRAHAKLVKSSEISAV